LAERFHEITTLAKKLREKDQEIEAEFMGRRKAEVEVTAVLQQFGEKDKQLESARQEREELEAKTTAAIDQMRGYNGELEARIAERFNEIALLTRMLSEREASLAAIEQQKEWIRETTSVLLNGWGSSWKNFVYSVFPARWRRSKQLKQLRQKRLFDVNAYVSANPDVIKAGHDPLRHYINHGLLEGRVLNIQH
jgi:hypothetical protein